MKTALDVMDRIKDIDKYLRAIKESHRSISNKCPEFGEGNPKANHLIELRDELEEEKDMLIGHLESMPIGENLYSSTRIIEQRPVYMNKQ